MIITTPLEITEILYGGTLQFDQTWGTTPTRDASEKLDEARVTIGQPQWWNVAEIHRATGELLPTTINLMLSQADFFLVRFACSLSPGRNTYLDWARFSVRLRPFNRDAANPIAFDLHPLEVYEHRKQGVQVEISPSLKFKDTEVNIGKLGMQVQYDELLPIITATGVQEDSFSWDLEKTSNHQLRGTRWFHALIKLPHGAGGAYARFDIAADIVTQRGLLRSSLRARASGRLSCLICI